MSTMGAPGMRKSVNDLVVCTKTPTHGGASLSGGQALLGSHDGRAMAGRGCLEFSELGWADRATKEGRSGFEPPKEAIERYQYLPECLERYPVRRRESRCARWWS